LLLVGKKSVFTETFDKKSFNLKTTLTKSKGYLSDLIAKHVVLNNYPPKLLTFIDTTDEENEESKDGCNLLKDQYYKEFYGLILCFDLLFKFY